MIDVVCDIVGIANNIVMC